MSIEAWEHFFKPEVRSSGRVYFSKGNVRSSQPSDTEIQAFIKGSTSYKVSFKSPSVESSLITVDCTCPASQKGQFCKHIWATFLKVEQSHSDFLDGKTEIQKLDRDPVEAKTQSVSRASLYEKTKQPLSQQQVEKREAYKTKQADYRKEQYQKQKQRLKERKQAGKKSQQLEPVIPNYPEDVKEALSFFHQNGFEMESTLNAEIVRLAKKHLSRVFHPDKGGSHEEIVALNENTNILMNYLEGQDH